MTLQQLLINGLRELAGMEKVLAVGLPGMVEAISNAELRVELAEHLTRTETQVKRIEEVSWSMGLESPSIACKPMIAMVGDAAKASCAAPTGVMRDAAMLGSAERMVHFEVAAYSSEILMAKSVGYGDLANLLEESLREEMKALNHFRKMRKALIKRAQKAAEMGSPAWLREVPS
jgi:ferritin-like metal-binding protein YciE